MDLKEFAKEMVKEAGPGLRGRYDVAEGIARWAKSRGILLPKKDAGLARLKQLVSGSRASELSSIRKKMPKLIDRSKIRAGRLSGRMGRELMSERAKVLGTRAAGAATAAGVGYAGYKAMKKKDKK